jgi:hypothetical protein
MTRRGRFLPDSDSSRLQPEGLGLSSFNIQLHSDSQIRLLQVV